MFRDMVVSESLPVYHRYRQEFRQTPYGWWVGTVSSFVSLLRMRWTHRRCSNPDKLTRSEREKQYYRIRVVRREKSNGER